MAQNPLLGECMCMLDVCCLSFGELRRTWLVACLYKLVCQQCV